MWCALKVCIESYVILLSVLKVCIGIFLNIWYAVMIVISALRARFSVHILETEVVLVC